VDNCVWKYNYLLLILIAFLEIERKILGNYVINNMCIVVGVA